MPATTTTSSVLEATQFDTGSGEALIASRPPDLRACVASAALPPTSAAVALHSPSGATVSYTHLTLPTKRIV